MLSRMFNVAICSIDATNVTSRLGRYVNDSPRSYANCHAKPVAIGGIPHILIFASKDIRSGTELRYDYGGYLPWRTVSNKFCLCIWLYLISFHFNGSFIAT